MLEWPGSSPDLNPIKNLWSLMKNKVSEKHPTNLDGGILEALTGASRGDSAGPRIAHPPNHLGSLASKTANTDSSCSINNDSDVASEKFRGCCTRIWANHQGKRSSFLKNIFTRKKGGPLPATTLLSNGQKNCKKIYSK